jgi:hypothetical protein
MALKAILISTHNFGLSVNRHMKYSENNVIVMTVHSHSLFNHQNPILWCICHKNTKYSSVNTTIRQKHKAHLYMTVKYVDIFVHHILQRFVCNFRCFGLKVTVLYINELWQSCYYIKWPSYVDTDAIIEDMWEMSRIWKSREWRLF